MDEPEAGTSGFQCKIENSPVFTSPTGKRLKQNPLSANEKQVVLNIHKLILEMWPKDVPLKRSDVAYKTALTAGISKATVYNILKEKENSGDVKSPPLHRTRKSSKFSNIDETTLSEIRRKVQDFFVRNETPTLDKVLAEVINDDSLPKMSRSTLHKILCKKLHFNVKNWSRGQNSC